MMVKYKKEKKIDTRKYIFWVSLEKLEYVNLIIGETTTCAVDSWTTCEELANLAVQNHGVDNTGWTITLWDQLDGPDAIVTETNGCDYVLDLISEMELAPAFPAAKHMFLEQRKNSYPPIKKRDVSLTPRNSVKYIIQIILKRTNKPCFSMHK